MANNIFRKNVNKSNKYYISLNNLDYDRYLRKLI